MLEQVGKPCPAGHFVLRSDVIPDLDADYGCVMVLDEQGMQAIGEGKLMDRGVRQVDRSRRGVPGPCEGQQKKRDASCNPASDSRTIDLLG